MLIRMFSDFLIFILAKGGTCSKTNVLEKYVTKLFTKVWEKYKYNLKILVINPSLPTPLGETGGAQLGPLAPHSSALPLSLARGLCTKYAHC